MTIIIRPTLTQGSSVLLSIIRFKADLEWLSAGTNCSNRVGHNIHKVAIGKCGCVINTAENKVSQ